MVLTGAYTGDGEDHPAVNNIFKIGVPIRTWTIVGNWIWTASSRVVNEARFGWNRVYLGQFNDDSGTLADGKGYPLNTGITTPGGFPTIYLGSFAPIGAWTNRPMTTTNPFYHYQDSISYLRGKHTFKFGGGFTSIEVDTYTGNTARGRIDFQEGQNLLPAQIPKSTGLEDFFAGIPSRGYQLIGNGYRTLHGRAASGFAQDDWRIAPKFMLNLGLRYAYGSPFQEANNLLGNFDPKLGMVQQGQPSVGDTLLHPNRKNFSPRVGFAWDVTGKGTTVVRAGASLIYSTLTSGIAGGLSLQDSGSTGLTSVPTGGCTTPVVVGVPCPKTFGGTNQLANFTYTGSVLNWNGVVFPGGAGISCTAAVPCNLAAVDPNLKIPYVVNYNLGVQHAFANNLSLEVGYVGTHGDNLLGFRDINQIDITTGVRPYATQFPYLKYINRISNQARSNYNSLQSTLTKRVSHGLSFTAGYTYGHGLDNGSLNRFGYLPQNSLNPGAEYAASDFDVRHRFTLTTTYSIPGKKGFGQLLQGWKLNSIVNLQSSQPWEPNDYTYSFSGSGDNADRWNFFGDPNDFRSGSSAIPYCSDASHCSVTSGISGIQSFFSGSQSAAMWGQCTAVAPDLSKGGTLDTGGCYVKGKSVMVPPAKGTYGSMGRNIFRDSGFKNWDFSIFKTFTVKERYSAQFRVEFFNLLNHPLISNPYGASTNYGGSGAQNDMGTPSLFGCGCATPDVSAGNPLIGSGSSRDIQLGLKLTF